MNAISKTYAESVAIGGITSVRIDRLLQSPLHHPGVDPSGADAVDIDVVFSQFHGQGPVEVYGTGLERPVAHLRGKGEFADDRRDVPDLAAALFYEIGNRCQTHQHLAPEIELIVIIPLGYILIGKCRTGACEECLVVGAEVVYQYVDLAESVYGLPYPTADR